jgi:type IV pilus assembly protein PilA
VSEWFHAEGSRQVGPVSADDMGELFRGNRIGLDTLVWRQGLPAWQPLRTVVDELGLTAVPAAAAATHVPPLPPGSPPAPPSPAAPYAGARALPMQAQKKPLSGCAMTAVIGGAALLVLVPVCAILAAIALPAYKDYTIRAKVAHSVGALQPLQVQVAEFVNREGRCPTRADPDFPAHDHLTAQGLSSVQFGQFENEHCGIEATLAVGESRVDGDLLWQEYDPQASRWECSGDGADKYLPVHCRD